MLKVFPLVVLLAASAALLSSQTTSPGTVQATGIVTNSVNPDQAQLDVSVITQGSTAQQASQQNAAQTTTVLNALKQTLGVSGTVQTINYSVYPRYSNSPGQNDVVVGYTASNTVLVTTNNLNLAGPLIDTANQAGASTVSNLTFGLQNPEPYKQQALSAAAKQAQAHATAIAAGLGAKTGAIVSAQEAAATSIYPVLAAGSAASSGTPTPVQTGTVSVSATVTITVQLLQ
jgi:uncharacterized protein YggE